MKLHVILSLFTLVAGVKHVRKRLAANADDTEYGTEAVTRQAGDTSTVAVLISGLEDSFNWAHAVDRVITPAARQGFTLDFYIRLVATGRSNGAQWIRVKNETGSGVDLRAWKKNVIAAGMQAAGFKGGAGSDQRKVKEDAGSDQSEVSEDAGSDQSEVKEDAGNDQSEVKEDAGADQGEVEKDAGADESEVEEDAGTNQGESKDDAGTDQSEVNEDAGTDQSEVSKERSSQVDIDEVQETQSKMTNSQGPTITDLARKADSEWGNFIRDLDAPYVGLAQSGADSHVRSTSWKDTLAQLPGSQIKSFELLNYKEHVVIPPRAPTKIADYDPVNTKTGRNLLRRFKSIEDLWHKALAEEKAGHFRYKFVMVAREDQTWMSTLNMNKFNTAGSQNAVFSKNCIAWGGLNDKVFVFGRLAAEKSLTRLYTDFWNSSVDGHNAESYWKANAASKGIQSVLVDPTELATSDTKWQNGKPCQHKHYHCAAAYEQPAVFCDDGLVDGCDCSWSTGAAACGGKGDGSFCWNHCCAGVNPVAEAAVKAENKAKDATVVFSAEAEAALKAHKKDTRTETKAKETTSDVAAKVEDESKASKKVAAAEQVEQETSAEEVSPQETAEEAVEEETTAKEVSPPKETKDAKTTEKVAVAAEEKAEAYDEAEAPVEAEASKGAAEEEAVAEDVSE